jgi:pyruvate dehydrogenase E1 component
LQRLDGPVRGNGKIVQELEGVFRGAGWHVIKVLWGRLWDPLLERDKTGLLQKRMNEVCDGELQNYKANGGAYTREHFFGKYPELLELVKDLSDDDIMRLNRGGHDPYKVYAAYSQAVASTEQPTVILAQTVKGYGMGDAGEAQNETHSLKKLDIKSLKSFRDRFDIPISDDQLLDMPYYRPAADSPELTYMLKRREELGGFLPKRQKHSITLDIPPLDIFKAQLKSSGERELSTTMAFVRMLSTLTKDKAIGERIVPIVPDEARTFGMEGMFRQLGIYSSVGQRYKPHDSDNLMYYKEDQQGQILEEGINEAGATSAWIACATSYSVSDSPLIPFYIFYSMFGFQRVMDLLWAAGDSQARGFLLGATSGRTTLNGEGLQHQDGHSHLMAHMIPNCISYDPTYAYELAIIIQHGLKRMYQDDENCFYYITLMNENWSHPDMPVGCEEGIINGMYKLIAATDDTQHTVQLLGSGAILGEVIEAAKILNDDYQIASDIWSMTSFTQLIRDAQECDRWNLLHPEEEQKSPYITQQLAISDGPVIAASDYIKTSMAQLAMYVPHHYSVLGTDGFGRSDTRPKLRHFFEVDRYFIVITSLKALADEGDIDPKLVSQAIAKFNIDPNKISPMRA